MRPTPIPAIYGKVRRAMFALFRGRASSESVKAAYAELNKRLYRLLSGFAHSGRADDLLAALEVKVKVEGDSVKVDYSSLQVRVYGKFLELTGEDAGEA